MKDWIIKDESSLNPAMMAVWENSRKWGWKGWEEALEKMLQLYWRGIGIWEASRSERLD